MIMTFKHRLGVEIQQGSLIDYSIYDQMEIRKWEVFEAGGERRYKITLINGVEIEGVPEVCIRIWQ